MNERQFGTDRLPAYMRAPADAYVEEGKPPGDFLYSLLCNDLRGTHAHADTANSLALQAWIWWLGDIPMEAQGSKEKVAAWIANGGLTGGKPVE